MTDQDALKYAGMMGHPYAAVETTDDGRVRVCSEFNSVGDIVRCALDKPGRRFYVRKGKGYIRVTQQPMPQMR